MPAMDLIGVKRIAARKELPYQKLIIQAVERFIDEEEVKELGLKHNCASSWHSLSQRKRTKNPVTWVASLGLPPK